MQNISQTLTSKEKEIIKEIALAMSSSLTRLADQGHPEFEALKEAYDDVNDSDVALNIVDRLMLFDKMQEEPEHITKLDDLQLTLAKFIILDYLPRSKYTIAKKNLLKKLNHLIEVREMNDINLN
jgi:hypothetical protein